MDIYREEVKKFRQILDKEVQRRAERMKNILTDSDQEIKTKQAVDIELCKKDIHYWLENYVWLYEPRPTPKNIPFMHWNTTYPDHVGSDFQRRLIDKLMEKIDKGEDLRIEKSRDMGATWSVLLVFTYLWQFHNMTFLAGSRKAEEVDKLGDLDTLLPKIRFVLENQPEWLIPVGFDMDKHAGWMNLLNPISKGSITGESNNASFATGGRKNAVMFDEFSKWEYTDSQAWISAGQTTPCRIALSTPKFKNNRFYVLKSQKLENFSEHWSEHPLKACDLKKNEKGKVTSSWYEAQKERYTPDEIAQELDISYSGTRQSTILHDEIAQLRIERRLAKVDYMPGRPVVWAFDPGAGELGSAWANGFFQLLGYAEEIRWFDYYENNNEGLDHYIDWVKHPDRYWNKVKQELPSGGSNYCKGWKEMIVVPDPNEANQSARVNNKSLAQLLREHGFKNLFIKRIGKIEKISEGKRIFPQLWMDNGQQNQRMILALDRIESWHRKFNEATQEYGEPVHDANCHCFIKGTNILTSTGKKRIEDIKIGEYVMTPTGSKKVFNAGYTGMKTVYEILFSNNKKLNVTGNHPIKTKNRGYIRVDKLRYDDIIEVLTIKILLWQKLLNFKVWFINLMDTIIVRIGLKDKRIIVRDCMLKFGNFILLKKYLKDMQSTIKTLMHTIITIPIWSYLRSRNTVNCTPSLVNGLSQKRIENIWPIFGIWQQSGIGVKQEEIIQKRHVLKHGKNLNLQRKNVLFAEEDILTNRGGSILNFVLINVGRRTEETRRRMTLQKIVLFVKRTLQRINMLKRLLAPVNVVSLNIKGQEQVYNLSVEENPCYYANSILVHNCGDMFCYFANYVKNPNKAREEVEQEKDVRDRTMNPQPTPETGMAGY